MDAMIYEDLKILLNKLKFELDIEIERLQFEQNKIINAEELVRIAVANANASKAKVHELEAKVHDIQYKLMNFNNLRI
jgi:hypothetical protein